MTGAAPRQRLLVVESDGALGASLGRRLEQGGQFEVVGVTPNGRSARLRILAQRPDLLLVDLGGDFADRDELLRGLHTAGSPIRRVVVAPAALRAEVDVHLAAWGQPTVLGRAENACVDELAASLERELQQQATPRSSAPRPRAARTPLVVGLGISTGGPRALTEVLPKLSADFPVPILVVQHMPPKFTASLADSLDKQCRLRVREAGQGDPVQRGEVLIAPGGAHMRVVARGGGQFVQLTMDPPICSCRPSVDYLFRSLRITYGGRVVGCVMTGMGEDGWAGSRELHEAGAFLLAQDQASSTVYGMPRGPIESGIARATALGDMAIALESAARGLVCG